MRNRLLVPPVAMVIAATLLAACSGPAKSSNDSASTATSTTKPAATPPGVVVAGTGELFGQTVYQYACAPGRKPIDVAVPYGRAQEGSTKFWVSPTITGLTSLYVQHNRTSSVSAIAHIDITQTRRVDYATSFATPHGEGHLRWKVKVLGEALGVTRFTVCYG